MIKLRILHQDGRDEVYDQVVKTTMAYDEYGNKILGIYTKNMTYHVGVTETVFIQHWDEESE